MLPNLDNLGGGGDVWFVYDAAGERVRKVQVNTSGSAVRERIYVGGYEVYRERAANSATPDVERQTLHVGDDRGKLALVETLTVDAGTPAAAPASVQRHQHGNHLGSASLELDADAAVISYEEFHPFGTSSYAANDSDIEVSAKRYRYIGKERDDETGLYHLGARYYASWLARWTAADPIGLGDGVNRYAYARGNPSNLRDDSGHRAKTTHVDFSGEPLVVHGQLPQAGPSFTATQDETPKAYFYGGYTVEPQPTHTGAVEQAPDVLGALEALGGLAEALVDAFTPRLEPRPGDAVPNIIGVVQEGLAVVDATAAAAEAVADAQANLEIAEATGDEAVASAARRERARAGVVLGVGVASIAGGARVPRGPLKVRSGDLDSSASARRTQPHRGGGDGATADGGGAGGVPASRVRPNITVETLEEAGGAAHWRVSIEGKESLQIMSNVRKVGDVLHLDEFHIYDTSGDAVGFNRIGAADLIRAGRELGRMYDVSEVQIIGGKRVTGANVGRRHRVSIKVPGRDAK